MQNLPSSKNSDAAFTLIELYVVIACVAMLTLLVLPALAATKPKDQTASCMSNLRKWGLAQQVYAAENKDTIPCDGTMTPTGIGYGQYAPDSGATTGPGSPLDPVAWVNGVPQVVGVQTGCY